MKTHSRENLSTEQVELVEFNPTPRKKLMDLEYLTLVGDEPIRRVFVYTGQLPADNYTRIHPCHGEGTIRAVQLDRRHGGSFIADFYKGEITLSLGGSRLLGIPERHYIIYTNPLKQEVESNYHLHLAMGNLI
ncbi:MAG: hypothetical protein HY512_01190 [Candidatus Aenigmarchaeota archaeon]|nr:hypothetical protein [Candidatus Aenigmarchaeota archaeon]